MYATNQNTHSFLDQYIKVVITEKDAQYYQAIEI